MIDHVHRIILIHIPKCAGSSLEQFLIGQDWWFIDPTTKHSTARQLRQIYGEEIWNSYYKIVIIRNPWTRLLSSYNWHKNRSPHNFKQYGCETFDAYVRKMCLVEPHMPDGILHGASILEYITDEQGNIMVDYICRFETLANDIKFLKDKFHLTGELPLQNETVYDRDLTKWYTSELRDIVAKRYANDIRTFGYTFDDRPGQAYSIVNPPHLLNRRVYPFIQPKQPSTSSNPPKPHPPHLPQPQPQPKPNLFAQPKPAPAPAQPTPPAQSEPTPAPAQLPQLKLAPFQLKLTPSQPKPAPQPPPQSQPKPAAQSQSQPQPQPQPQPKQASQPQPQPQPQSQSQPQPQPKPQSQSQPKPAAQPQSQSQPAAQSQSQSQPKAAAQPESQPQPQPQSQSQPQPESQPGPQNNQVGTPSSGVKLGVVQPFTGINLPKNRNGSFPWPNILHNQAWSRR